MIEWLICAIVNRVRKHRVFESHSPQMCKAVIPSDQNVFDSFLETFIFSKLLNLKVYLFKNVKYNDYLLKSLIKPGLVYYYYLPLNVNNNLLLIGIKDNNFFDNLNLKESESIKNIEQMLNILSNDSYFQNLNLHSFK